MADEMIPAPVPDYDLSWPTVARLNLEGFLPTRAQPGILTWRKSLGIGEEYLSIMYDGDDRMGRRMDEPAYVVGRYAYDHEGFVQIRHSLTVEGAIKAAEALQKLPPLQFETQTDCKWQDQGLSKDREFGGPPNELSAVDPPYVFAVEARKAFEPDNSADSAMIHVLKEHGFAPNMRRSKDIRWEKPIGEGDYIWIKYFGPGVVGRDIEDDRYAIGVSSEERDSERRVRKRYDLIDILDLARGIEELPRLRDREFVEHADGLELLEGAEAMAPSKRWQPITFEYQQGDVASQGRGISWRGEEATLASHLADVWFNGINRAEEFQPVSIVQKPIDIDKQSAIDLQVAIAKRKIHADILAGTVDVAGVSSFGDLHDYVDANFYLSDDNDLHSPVGLLAKMRDLHPKERMELMEEVAKRLDHWITDGGLHPSHDTQPALAVDPDVSVSESRRIRLALKERPASELAAMREQTDSRLKWLQSKQSEGQQPSRRTSQEIRQLQAGQKILSLLGHGNDPTQSTQPQRRNAANRSARR